MLKKTAVDKGDYNTIYLEKPKRENQSKINMKNKNSVYSQKHTKHVLNVMLSQKILIDMSLAFLFIVLS